MTLEETLNDLLVKLFKDILEIEAKSLITEEFKDISYNDMHIIEAVGIDEPRNMKTVAKLMQQAHSRKQWMPCVRKDMLSGNGVRGIKE